MLESAPTESAALAWIDRIVDPGLRGLAWALGQAKPGRAEVLDLCCDGGPRLARLASTYEWVTGIQSRKEVLDNAWSYLEERLVSNVVLSSRANLDAVERPGLGLVFAMPSIWTDAVPVELLCHPSPAARAVLLPIACPEIPLLDQRFGEFSREAIEILEEQGFAQGRIWLSWEAPARIVFRSALERLSIDPDRVPGRSAQVEYATLLIKASEA